MKMVLMGRCPLHLDIDFQDGPDPDISAAWRTVCEAENALAEELVKHPLGAVFRHEDHVWILWPNDLNKKLTIFCAMETESFSRCHNDLAWIDDSAEALLAYADYCKLALSRDAIGAVSEAQVRLLLDEHSEFFMRLCAEEQQAAHDKGVYATADVEERVRNGIKEWGVFDLVSRLVTEKYWNSPPLKEQSTEASVVGDIHKLLEQADKLWSTLSPATKNHLNAVHNEEASLGHCLRWGVTASEELSDRLKDKQFAAGLAEADGSPSP